MRIMMEMKESRNLSENKIRQMSENKTKMEKLRKGICNKVE